jgi:hypothetical protein
MMYENIDDVIDGDFHCPRCGMIMREIRPKDDIHLIRDKEYTIRLLCVCGYYEDRVVKPDLFKNSP